MAEHDLQYNWIVTIKEGLQVQYREDDGVYIGADLFWYPVEGQPNIRTAPDTLIVFGSPKGLRSSYKQWVEGGIPPQVISEVHPPGDRPGEMRRKFLFYQRYGAEEYYIYDPFKGTLEGYIRRGQRLVKIARMNGHVSPRLGIRFERAGESKDNLTIYGRNGKPFVTPLETSLRLADEHHRAETAEQRAARYAEKLREMGIEPD